MKKRLTFVGADAAPTNCFNLLESAFRSQANPPHINKIVGGGAPIPLSDTEIVNAVGESDLLVLGLSSQANSVKKELVAAHAAISAGVPYGFYSDMALCPFRPWLQGVLAKGASFLVGLLPDDTASLMSMYPNAQYLSTGNPFRGDMAFPIFTRDEVRRKLGIQADEKLIIACGNKFAAGNFQVWGLLLEALESAEYREKVVVMIAPHPGDSTLRAIDSTTGSELPLYRELLAETSVRTLYRAMPTPDAVAGADVVVDFTGDTSVRSAYQRIPLINITTEALLKRFEKETTSRDIETVKNGAGFHLPFFSATHLRDAIAQLLNKDSDMAIALREKQAVTYPIPANQHASHDALVGALTALLDTQSVSVA